jgi:hypothetical protein
MKHCLFILIAFFTLAIDRVGADDKTNKVPKGTEIFIAPMEDDLHPLIAAEIAKKRLPVVVVMEEKNADFILSNASIKAMTSGFIPSSGEGQERRECAIDQSGGEDDGLGRRGRRPVALVGRLETGGQRKVADRIVNKMNKDLFK